MPRTLVTLNTMVIVAVALSSNDHYSNSYSPVTVFPVIMSPGYCYWKFTTCKLCYFSISFPFIMSPSFFYWEFIKYKLQYMSKDFSCILYCARLFTFFCIVNVMQSNQVVSDLLVILVIEIISLLLFFFLLSTAS